MAILFFSKYGEFATKKKTKKTQKILFSICTWVFSFSFSFLLS
jgi:hypothetical protein